MAPPLGTWLPRLLRLAAFTAVAADAACRAARVGRTTLGAAALETLAALPAADVATVRCGELQGTLLHEAVEGGDLEVVKLLLARGGAQTVNAKDRFLKTPLAWAALKGRVEVTKLLLASNATVNAKDEFLATPLSDAAQEGHVEVAKLLLQHGAEMEARGQMGRTPLMEAAEQGHLEVADLLIQEGADLDAVDYAGRPPLVHAAIQGEQDMVELLVENGANVFGSSNDGIAFYKSGPPEIQSYIGQQMRFRSLITQPCFLWILLGAPALGVLWAALQRALRGGLPSSFVEIPSERQMVESELLEDTEDDEQSEFFHGAKLLLAQTSLSPFHRFLEVATCAVLIFGFGVSVVWWAFWIPLHVFFYLLPALLAYPCHLLMTRPALFLTFSLSSAAAPLLQLLRTTLLLALVLLVAARHRSECVWVSSVWAAPICRDQSAMAGGATSTSFYVDSLQLSSLNWYELLLDPSTSWQLEGVTLFGFQLRPFLLTAAFFIFLLLTSLAYMATLLLKCFASMTRPCVTDQGLSPSEAVRLQMLLRAAAPSTFPKDVAPEKGRSLHGKLLLLILDVAFDVNTVYTLMFTGNPLFAFALMLVLSRSLAQQLFSGACRLPEAVQESTRRGMMRKDLLDIFDEEQGFQAFASLCLTSLSYWYCIQDAYQATAQIISILLSTYSVSSYLFRRIDAEIET
ncbi:unnamed protein product [Durusdinium trenchii]|uniref:Uncharacterized protein n=1 Tax=Durusdinium trenchii TaxID=1381693 RepID=A0ABP0SWG8_9DINO